MSTSDPRDVPVVQLTDAATADLQLVLDGVLLPWTLLGEVGSSDEREHAVAGTPGGVALAVPEADAARASVAGGMVLTDRENTPVAQLTEPLSAQPSTEGTVVLRGQLRGARIREARLFADRALAPAALADPVATRVAVVVGRPPLTGELTQLYAGNGDTELVVLVPVEGPSHDGIPPAVLMRCAEVAVAAEVPGAVVIPVAMRWRGESPDLALTAALGSAYGAARSVLLGATAAWHHLLALVQVGDPLPAVAAPGVLSELRAWRPPRDRRGLVVFFTGFSGSGKSTLARDLAAHVEHRTRRTVSLLDGDDVRRLLSSGLGFDRAARDLNVRRIGFVATEVARHGGIAICAPIAPYAETRAAVRDMVKPVGDFVLVHVSTPLEACEKRDLKGLYARARNGEIREFTGISDPYDVPEDAAVTVDTSAMDRAAALQVVLDHLYGGGWITP